MNVLALSNVVFAQGGDQDKFGGNFGHLERSEPGGEEAEQVNDAKVPITQQSEQDEKTAANKLM